MLFVYMQMQGCELLRDTLRSHPSRGIYVEGPPAAALYTLPKELGLRSLKVAFPEHGLHPEDQAKVAKTLVLLAMDIDVHIATNSLVVLNVINNALIEDGTIGFEAYMIERGGTREVMMRDRWIDETPLSWVPDKLERELNELCRARDERSAAS